jgi:tRNA-Thr(GGU) m(6)t(6)A37 methyltransferase TsaA
MSYALQPIGVVKSPYKSREEAPRQGVDREEVSTLLFYDKKHVDKLRGSKRLRLLYWMHLANRKVLWGCEKRRGIFATRSPDRPNPIGIAIVEVIKTQDKKVLVKHLDALDGTPILRAIPL